MNVYMHKGFLLALPVRTTYVRVHEGMLCSQNMPAVSLWCTHCCVLSPIWYVISPICILHRAWAVPVWWIKKYYNNKSFKYIFMYTFIINWLSLTLWGFFNNPVADITRICDGLIISMLGFKRIRFIILTIRISAGQEGIIIYCV